MTHASPTATPSRRGPGGSGGSGGSRGTGGSGGAGGAGGKAGARGDGLGALARGGALSLVGAAVSAVLNVGLVVLVTRGVSKAEAGVFFAATSLFLLGLAVGKLGTSTGLVYFITRFRMLGQGARIRRLHRVALAPVVIAATVLGGLLYGLAPWLADLALAGPAGPGGPGGDAAAWTVERFAGHLHWLALFLPLAALSDTLLAATRGFRTQRPTALVDSIGRPLGQLTFVAAAVVAATAGAPLLGLAWAAPYLPAALLAWLWLRSLERTRAGTPRGEPADGLDDGTGDGPGTAPPAGAEPARAEPPGTGATGAGTTGTEPDETRPVETRAAGAGGESGAGADGAAPEGRSLAAEFWRYTWPRTFASVAQLALQRFDIVLVAALRGPAEAAIYTAATRFLVVGQLGAKAISTAVQPQLGERLAVDDAAGARTLYRTGTAWLMLLTWPLYLLCVVFAEPMLGLFGQGYAAGVPVILVLTGAMLVATGCGMVDMVLSMSGRTSWNLVNTVAALAVNVAVDLVLIPRIGILGAAIGWAAAIVFNNVVPLVQVGLWLRLRLHPFGAATLAAAVLPVLCFGVLPLSVRAVAGSGMIPLLTAAAAGALLYGAGCWRLRRTLRLTSLRALLPRGTTGTPGTPSTRKEST